jgi:hypothetical protein
VDKRKLKKSIEKNLFEVIFQVQVFKKGEQCTLEEFLEKLKLGQANLEKLHSHKKNIEILVNSKSNITAQIIHPFQTVEQMNESKVILANDLEVLFTFKDNIKVSSVKNNKITQADLFDQNVILKDKETLEKAHAKALQIVNKIQTEGLNSNSYEDIIDKVEDKEIVRSILNVITSIPANVEIELINGDKVNLNGIKNLPTKLDKNEFSLIQVNVEKFRTKDICILSVSSINKEFKMEHNLTSIDVFVVKDSFEYQLFKLLEVIKLNFDIDIASTQDIRNDEIGFSLLKIHNHNSLIEEIINKVSKLENNEL